MSLLTLSAKLDRSDGATSWGFRMYGGKDFGTPLTIQRVTPGSLAQKCGVQEGDVITKIGEAPTEYMRHKEAQHIIVNSGNSLELALERLFDHMQRGSRAGRGGGAGYGTGAPRQQFTAPRQQFSAAPAPAPPAPAPVSPGAGYTQDHNRAAAPFSPGGTSPHVPVAVNKQYNTPINMYSMDNVMESLVTQTSAISVAPPAGGAGGSGGGRGNTNLSLSLHDPDAPLCDTHAPDVTDDVMIDDVTDMPDLFKGHALPAVSSPDEDEASQLESYMKKRGRRRPSQDFLDSRHLLPWQQYQASRKYAPVRYVIPTKEKNSLDKKESVAYPFEFKPDEPEGFRSSRIPETDLTLNPSMSPQSDLSSPGESEESGGSFSQPKFEFKDRANTTDNPPISRKLPDTDEVDGTVPENLAESHENALSRIRQLRAKRAEAENGSPSHRRRKGVGPATTNIAHHKPSVQPIPELGSPSSQPLTPSYYQRRRSHQVVPGRGSLESSSGFSKPKGFHALKGIFEGQSEEVSANPPSHRTRSGRRQSAPVTSIYNPNRAVHHQRAKEFENLLATNGRLERGDYDQPMRDRPDHVKDLSRDVHAQYKSPSDSSASKSNIDDLFHQLNSS